jgi:glycosyltransferase involved in cell wall biosynthesis
MLEALKKTKLRRFTLFLEQGEIIEALCYIVTRLGIRLPPPRPQPRALTSITHFLPCSDARGRVKLVACAHSLAREGAPISLLEILIGLSRVPEHRFDIDLIASHDGPLAERARAAGIPVHIVQSPQEHWGGARVYEHSIARFAQTLTALRPDIVIANSIAAFHAIDAARHAGIASLWLIREADALVDFLSLHPRAIQRRGLACLEYPARMIFVSRSTLDRWPATHVPRVLIRTVPDRADVARLVALWSRNDARGSLALADDEIMVLTVGTFCTNKGQMDLLAVAPALVRESTRVRLVFVGSPAEPGGEAFMQAVARASEAVRPVIEVHAATDDIGRFYAAADIYVCGSRSEGYPRTILEALAFGLPIVTTGVGGVAEALEGTRHQAFEPAGTASLTSALQALIDSAELRSAMSDASLQRSAQLRQQPDMIDAYVRQIDAVLAGAQPP